MQPVSINIYNNNNHSWTWIPANDDFSYNSERFFSHFLRLVCSNDSWRTVSIRFMLFFNNFFLCYFVENESRCPMVGLRLNCWCHVKWKVGIWQRLNLIVLTILLWALSTEHWTHSMKENACFGRVHSIELLVDSMK